MKMKSVVMTAPRELEIRELEVPTPGYNQVLIEVKSCNICTFEQRIYQGEYPNLYPFNGGHELAGRISAIGENVIAEQYPIGQKVAVKTYDACGSCYYCRHGAPDLCTHKMRRTNFGTSYEGVKNVTGFSNYMVIGIEALYFLPEDLPWQKAIFCEPLACVCNSIDQAKIEFGNDVVVIGGGIMGMLHVMLSKIKGARVIMSEPNDERRKLAKELGADIVVNPMETDIVNYVKELTGGRGADVVFNTTPVSSVAKQAIEMCGKLGRVVMYSSQHPDTPIEVSPNWLHSSKAILTGVVNPSIQSFEWAVNLISKNIIDPSKLYYGGFKVDDAKEALETACRPDTYRCSIDFDLD